MLGNQPERGRRGRAEGRPVPPTVRVTPGSRMRSCPEPATPSSGNHIPDAKKPTDFAVYRWIKSSRFYIAAKNRKSAERVKLLLPGLPRGASQVLDFGCGNMNLAKAIVESGLSGAKITGLELVQHRDMELSGGSNLEFKIYKGLTLPFSDNFFDAAIAIGALHHTIDPQHYLKELARVTKPGGTIQLLEWSYKSVLRYCACYLNDRLRNGIFKPEISSGLKILSDRQWQDAIQSAGLELIESRRVSIFTSLMQETFFHLRKK
jgi:SAM-dependent methyltransferase